MITHYYTFIPSLIGEAQRQLIMHYFCFDEGVSFGLLFLFGAVIVHHPVQVSL